MAKISLMILAIGFTQFNYIADSLGYIGFT